MPPQKQQNSLVARLGQRGRQAHEKHKADETTYGIINLPPGINGGTAQIISAKWAEFDEKTRDERRRKQPYVMLRGIAIEPLEHAGVRVRGQGVMIMVPLCDTTRYDGSVQPFEDHYADLLNEFRKLGVETEGTDFGDIDTVLTMLQEERPYFKFSTRGFTPPATPQKPRPQEMVFIQFDGRIDDYQPAENITVGVQDGTGDESDKGGESGPTARPRPNGKKSVSPTPSPSSTAATAVADQFDEFGDLSSLVTRATAQDGEAQATLTEMAIKAGVDEAVIDKTDSWEEVKEMILAGTTAETQANEEQGSGETGETGTVEPEWLPEKGQVYRYRPIDPKTKKPVRKAVDVEVLTVHKNLKEVDLMNSVAGRDKKGKPKVTYTGISWDDLESADEE